MFDPRALLKRLNRLIESFVPPSWTQGAMDQHRPAPKEMRRLLLSEAKTIRKLLDSAFGGHGTLLKELIDDLSRKPDRELLEQWDRVCEELLTVRRALYRLILARQSRTDLLNEWNDWERHGQASRDDKHLARFERQEMLASELRLRGIEVERKNEGLGIKDMGLGREEEQTTHAPISSSHIPYSSTGIPSLADDWEPMWLNRADESAEFWESMVAGCDAPQMTSGQAMRIAKGFKLAQGDRKQADRARGIRRYRLAVFEV